MVIVLLTVAAVYNFSFGRLLFVSGLEKRLPHQFGRVNKNKVPANAITLQTVISTVLAVLDLLRVRPWRRPTRTRSSTSLYAGVTIIWCISTALLFLDIFFAKNAEPELFERERRISVGWLYVCGVVGFVVNILAVLFIFVGSWYPTGFPTLASGTRGWSGLTAVSVVAAIAIYVVSQRRATGSPSTRWSWRPKPRERSRRRVVERRRAFVPAGGASGR